MNKSTTKPHKKRRLVPRGTTGNAQLYNLKSKRFDNVRYNLRVFPNGSITCNCPAGERGILCWHVKQAQAHEQRKAAATPVAPRQEYRCVGPIDTDEGCIEAHVEYVPATPAPCAHRAEPPFNVKCAQCGTQTADNYVPELDAAGEPHWSRWVCLDCSTALAALVDLPDDFPNYQTEADKQAEAEYCRSLDAAESFGSFVERVAQAEAAEYDGDEYDGGDASC